MGDALTAWLSAAEIEALTGRKRHSAQARKLAEMSIPFRPSGTGRPLVERSAVLTAERKSTAKGPRWDRMPRAA